MREGERRKSTNENTFKDPSFCQTEKDTGSPPSSFFFFKKMFPPFYLRPRKVSELKTTITGNGQIYLFWFRRDQGRLFSFIINGSQNIVSVWQGMECSGFQATSCNLNTKPSLGMRVKPACLSILPALAESLSKGSQSSFPAYCLCPGSCKSQLDQNIGHFICEREGAKDKCGK